MVCLWIVSGIVMVRQLYLFLCKKFQSEGRFFSFSKAELLLVWIGVPLATGLMFILHIYGFLIGILLGHLVVWLTVRRGERVIKGHRFQIHSMLKLMRVGFPIIVIGLLLSVLKSMDKLMILFFLERTELGYYGMAFVAANFIGFFPRAIGSVLYPRLMEEFGEKEDKLYLKRFLIAPSLLLVSLMLLMIGAVYLCVPAGIRIFLPQYIPSIPSLKILSLGFYFMALLEVPLYILIGINLQKKLLPILLISALFLLGVNFLALSSGFSIEGVSFSIGLTFFGLTTVVMLLVLDQVSHSLRDKAHFFSQIYFPFFYTLIVLLLLDRWLGVQSGKSFQLLWMTSFQVLIFLGSLIPVFIYVNRKINMMDRILSAIRLKDGVGRGSFFDD